MLQQLTRKKFINNVIILTHSLIGILNSWSPLLFGKIHCNVQLNVMSYFY